MFTGGAHLPNNIIISSRALKVMVENHPECANAKDENGLTPLHNAVLNNHFNAVSMLLKQVPMSLIRAEPNMLPW